MKDTPELPIQQCTVHFFTHTRLSIPNRKDPETAPLISVQTWLINSRPGIVIFSSHCDLRPNNQPKLSASGDDTFTNTKCDLSGKIMPDVKPDNVRKTI